VPADVPDRFPNGATHVVTQQRDLPSGHTLIEVLLPSLDRRRFLLSAGQATDDLLAEIAGAMRENRRVVKGQRVGGQ
jgi:hypothetical protein